MRDSTEAPVSGPDAIRRARILMLASFPLLAQEAIVDASMADVHIRRLREALNETDRPNRPSLLAGSCFGETFARVG